jgi:hypothetical protein
MSVKVVSCSNINGYLRNYQDCLTLVGAVKLERQMVAQIRIFENIVILTTVYYIKSTIF